MSAPIAIFGTSLVGASYTTAESVRNLLNVLESIGINHIDTAARYPPTSPGQSEKLLGAAGVGSRNIVVDTKIFLGADARGSLSASAIERSIANSLDVLGKKKVGTLYCHAPDPETPLDEQAAALDKAYREGKFEKLGISNFSIDMMSALLEICKMNNYVLPTVYQGQYNLVHRGDEAELLPFLKRNKIAYRAYSPLAGGFLTGRFTAGDVENTRFAPGNPLGNFFRALYDKPAMHDAIQRLQVSLETHGLSMPEVALRWLFNHSALGPEDGVILGASRPEQVQQNMNEIQRGPLPTDVLRIAEGIWGLYVES